MFQIGRVGTSVFTMPTRVARKSAMSLPHRNICPDRQLPPSSCFHTKTVLKDRRKAQTSHATFPETAGIFRRPEGAGGVSYTQNEMEKKLNTRLRASVANVQHPVSNRHPCRLETHLSPCSPMTSLFLIVTRRGGLFRTKVISGGLVDRAYRGPSRHTRRVAYIRDSAPGVYAYLRHLRYPPQPADPAVFGTPHFQPHQTDCRRHSNGDRDVGGPRQAGRPPRERVVFNSALRDTQCRIYVQHCRTLPTESEREPFLIHSAGEQLLTNLVPHRWFRAFGQFGGPVSGLRPGACKSGQDQESKNRSGAHRVTFGICESKYRGFTQILLSLSAQAGRLRKGRSGKERKSLCNFKRSWKSTFAADR
jgi:hypothetical protein